jgi:glucose/arabinose dehydrogenase/plastocyanin
MSVRRSPHPALFAAIILAVAACGSGEDNPTNVPTPNITPEASASATASASASASPGAGASMTDPSLAVSTFAEGLDQPTGIAFVAEGDALVTEKASGRVMRVTDGNVVGPVVDLAVNAFDERGLLGIAIHPDFASTNFVYLYWTQRQDEGGSGATDDPESLLGEDSEEATAVPDLGNRVDRFTWDGNALTWDRNIVRLPSRTLDTDTSGRVRGNHDAGPIAFGPDGKLYVTQGDQNLRGQLQNVQDGPAPADPDFAGMILRLEDDGSTPQDNRFVAQGEAIGGTAGENIQKIFAYGVRNTFGLAFDPTTGSLWQTENGDDAYDEINVFPAGANSGWIQLMGPPERFDEWKELEVASEDGLDNPDFPPDMLAGSAEEAQSRLFSLDGSQYVPPVLSYVYPPALTAVWIVRDDALGPDSQDTAFLGTVLTDALLRYPLAADGSGFELEGGLGDQVDDNTAKGDLGESQDYVVGTGFGVVTDIRQGPDGSLYVVSLSEGIVHRIGPGDGGAEPSGSPAASPPAASPPAASASPSGATTEVTIGTTTNAELQFDPTSASVPTGSQVVLTFENRDTLPHNLTFEDPIDAATSTVVEAGASEVLEFQAPEPGSYPFVCTLHPGMDGTLEVTP